MTVAFGDGMLVNRHAIQRVWALVPDAGCKGLCAEACGPIDASPTERALLAEQQITLPNVEETVVAILRGDVVKDCPALVDGRCSVYDIRPTICRLWGAVEGMPCLWGCVPERGRLSDEVAAEILAQAATA